MKKAFLIAVFLMGSFSAQAATEIVSSEYSDAIKSGLSLVEFYSPGCPHCRNMEPIIAKFEKQYTGIKVYRLNVLKEVKDNKPTELMTNLKIESWPTFLVYKDGVEIYRFKGEMSADKFTKRALITEEPTQDKRIDLRVEDLQDEYNQLVDRGNRMSDELRKIQERVSQIPAAIDELNKLKADM